MQINSVSSTNDNQPKFTSLKKVHYTRFYPKTNPYHARTIKNFLENKAFQKLFEKYDVTAEFSDAAGTWARTGLTLFCQKIDANKEEQPEKKSIIDKVKSLFARKEKEEPIELRFSTVFSRRLDEVIERTTEKDIENAFKSYEHRKRREQEDAEQFENNKKTIGEWL